MQALDEPLSQYIDCLQQCATTYHSEKKQKIRVFEKIVEGEIKEYTCKYTVDVLQLDYYVTPATKQAFAHFFGDAKSLFEVFYQLNMLNIHALSDKQIREVQSSDRDFDIVAYLPKKAQDELIFGIEEIKILKTDNSIVDYRGLSDGEHQFLHIMGTVLLMNEPNTLFILDEPETHFNPQWRSKLVSTFNQIAQVQQEQRNQQMFVLTTHSPFVVSDCRTENVFKFEKGDLSAKTLEINTYGSPFETLLYEAFEKEESISEMANAELKKWHKELKTLLDGTQSEECKMIEIDKLKSKIIQHSDSIERNMLLEYLNRQRKFLLSPQKSINHAPIFSDNS